MAVSEAEKQKYWPAETRAYADSFRNRGAVDYTINIPGIQDIVRIPVLEDKELKRQRWLRYKNTKNPAPGYAQLAAQHLNFIDDAQDLLFTALALAWPLLRKLPYRFLPGLGWILAANDVLNMMTCLLGFAARPGLTKPECFQILATLRGGRVWGVNRALKFLQKFPLYGFVLQAPQALFTVTKDILGGPGYGVLPGPIMGMLSDTFWALLRSERGTVVRFNTPPPADFVSKAFRFLSHPPYHHGAGQAFSLEDHLMLSAATNIASQVAALIPVTDDMAERAELLFYSQTPQYTPWTESSLEIALSEGWRDDLEPRDLVLPGVVGPTYGDVLKELTVGWYDVEQALSAEWGGSTLGTINSMLVYEAGDRILNWLNGEEQMFKPRFSQMEKAFARQFEYGIFPPEQMLNVTLEQYLTTAQGYATVRGAGSVSITDLQTTREQFFPTAP